MNPDVQLYEIRETTRIQRAMARQMRASHADKPPVTLHRSPDVGPLLAWLEEAFGGRSALTASLVSAAAKSFVEHRALNGHLVDGETRTFDRADTAVAVETEAGLFTPVVREAHAKGVGKIIEDIATLSARAHDGGLRPDDLADATFTISNLGAWGVEYFTPIINPPQIAILGVGRLTPRPTVVDGALVARPALPLSLSFDHAVVTGVEAARAMDSLAERLSAPDLTP
jgi:pyruvate dehydrogenase E2 component (dihydrolipoamide acetyltransferase)